MDVIIEQAEQICSALSDWMSISCCVDCIEMAFVYESLMGLLGKSVLSEKDLIEMESYIDLFNELNTDVYGDSYIHDEETAIVRLVC